MRNIINYMAKRRTRKQKIKAGKSRRKQTEAVKIEPKAEEEIKGKKLIIKDLKKTIWISLLLFSLLGLMYWLEIKTG